MKIDIIKTIIAIALSALIAYACYSISNYDSLRWIVTIGAFIAIGTPMLLALGITTSNPRGSVLLSVTSWVVALVMIITNVIFAYCEFGIPWYIILNGIILLIYLLIYRSLYKQDNI